MKKICESKNLQISFAVIINYICTNVMLDNMGYILYYKDKKEGINIPVISRFEGIVIKMYLRQKEHNPPHIHAIYGEYIGVFSILDGEMFEGDLPKKAQKLVSKFIIYHQERLQKMWDTCEFEMLEPVE